MKNFKVDIPVRPKFVYFKVKFVLMLFCKDTIIDLYIDWDLSKNLIQIFFVCQRYMVLGSRSYQNQTSSYQPK